MQYNNFVRKLIIPQVDLCLNVKFSDTLNKWNKFEKTTLKELNDTQEQKLNLLLNHAKTVVPFYIDLNNKSKLNCLQDFPILTKEILLEQQSRLFKMGVSREDLICERSSGSSGIQSEVFMSREEVYDSIAHQTYLWQWSGYKLGDKFLQLGMTTKRSFVKNLKDFLLRTKYTSAFNLDRDYVINVLKNIEFNKSYYLGGYASALYQYATIAKDSNIKNISFKAVISWGDKMFFHYRELIEQVFQTKVFDTYGSTEGFVIAGECEKGNYHILTPHIVLELLNDEDQEVKPGEIGKVVVTRLDAYNFPLIRYYLGDLAIKADPDEKCSCGRNFPILKKIIGRDTDIVKTRSGKSMIVHFFTGIFEHFPEIQQFKVVQYDLDSISIEYIPRVLGIELDNAIKKIEEIIHNKLEENFIIHFKQVEFIENSPSGKPQIVVSKL